MSEEYCVCKKPNTRQTAFARANAFACPDCGRTLNPDPSAQVNPQGTSTEPTNRPLSPDSYPSTLSALRSERGFTPPPSQLQPNNQRPEPNEAENRSSSQWPTPPLVEHPSQVRARTPTGLIEITPGDLTAVNLDPADIQPHSNRDHHSIEQDLLSDPGNAWDRLDEEFGEFDGQTDDFDKFQEFDNIEEEAESKHNISDHSYQSLILKETQEDTNTAQIDHGYAAPRPNIQQQQ